MQGGGGANWGGLPGSAAKDGRSWWYRVLKLQTCEAGSADGDVVATPTFSYKCRCGPLLLDVSAKPCMQLACESCLVGLWLQSGAGAHF
jgi:predicted SprT family Zn-dependent metalloprotease